MRTLIDHFVDEARSTVRPDFLGLSERTVRAMELASWPGNVRQLKGEIFRLAATTESGHLADTWISPDDRQIEEAILDHDESTGVLDDPELLRHLLRENGGRVADVARTLRVSRGHMYRVLKKLRIRVGDI